jgi:CDP-2,3-bis-(O-geranylgeranyl)-sn-glycerol synthase
LKDWIPLSGMYVLLTLILIVTANAAPIVIRNLLGERLKQPLDAGMMFSDGRPVFGASKTIVGLIASVVVTAAVTMQLGLSVDLGLLVAVLAMAGDLCASFIKRRIGLSPSSRAAGLDQIPESLFPSIGAAWYLDLTKWDILLIVVLFAVLEVALSPILFKLKIRNRPY